MARKSANSLVLESIRFVRFNKFSGPGIVDALQSSPHLWAGVHFDDDSTIHVLAVKGREQEIVYLFEGLDPDELTWEVDNLLLRAWWD